MSLPENIAVRYTEDDAGYVTVRPVMKQSFRLMELVDMVVSVAGKDAPQVQKILRAGAVVYNGYRYWWDGFSTDSADVASLLAEFPDDDPVRAFDPQTVSAVLLEIGGGTQLSVVEVTRKEASRKRLFRRVSPWNVLLGAARGTAPRYEKYSHARRADLFRCVLPFETARALRAELLDAAPGSLRRQWSALHHPPAALVFVSTRK